MSLYCIAGIMTVNLFDVPSAIQVRFCWNCEGLYNCSQVHVLADSMLNVLFVHVLLYKCTMFFLDFIKMV